MTTKKLREQFPSLYAELFGEGMIEVTRKSRRLESACERAMKPVPKQENAVKLLVEAFKVKGTRIRNG
jgi:hypothetical protein